MLEKTMHVVKKYTDDYNRYRNALKIIVEEARRRCPYDTHYLETHWQIVRKNKTNYNIVFTAPYAIFVHERLDVYHPHGEAKFLENAWQAKKDEFFKAIMKD
jgi:hypothetical protein